jgi:hypothetical protein
MSNSHDSDDTDDLKHKPTYAVGYKRPPSHSRFRKGRSGNPRGRPKKKPETYQQAFQRLVADKVVTASNGARLTAFEGMLRVARNNALRGNFRSLGQLTRFLERTPHVLPQSAAVESSQDRLQSRREMDALIVRMQAKADSQAPDTNTEGKVGKAVKPRRRKKCETPREIFLRVFGEMVKIASTGDRVTASDGIILVARSKAGGGDFKALEEVYRFFERVPSAIATSDEKDTTDYGAELLGRLKEMAERIRARRERQADEEAIARRRAISPDDAAQTPRVLKPKE